MPISCRICGNSAGNKPHRGREMMFGTRHEFDYTECAECGTLQINDVPDLTNYYPANYYSFGAEPEMEKNLQRRLAAPFIGREQMGAGSLVGRMLTRHRPWMAEEFPQYLRLISDKVGFDSRILDYGSGAGTLLRTMRAFGFRNLTGADKFVAQDLAFRGGLRIYKRSLEEIGSTFDLVMLNHSFEHVADPKAMLREVWRVVDPGKYALIRMPVLNVAWEKYGVNWVQMDPPRHLFIFNESTFRSMAENAGFEVERAVYDSEAFQFYGSEQYLRDIPLNDPRSYRKGSSENIFSEEEINEWERRAEKLNEEQRGDQACFYLRKP